MTKNYKNMTHVEKNEFVETLLQERDNYEGMLNAQIQVKKEYKSKLEESEAKRDHLAAIGLIDDKIIEDQKVLIDQLEQKNSVLTTQRNIAKENETKYKFQLGQMEKAVELIRNNATEASGRLQAAIEERDETIDILAAACGAAVMVLEAYDEEADKLAEFVEHWKNKYMHLKSDFDRVRGYNAAPFNYVYETEAKMEGLQGGIDYWTGRYEAAEAMNVELREANKKLSEENETLLYERNGVTWENVQTNRLLVKVQNQRDDYALKAEDLERHINLVREQRDKAKESLANMHNWQTWYADRTRKLAEDVRKGIHGYSSFRNEAMATRKLVGDFCLELSAYLD